MEVLGFAAFLIYIGLSIVTGVVAARRGGSGPRWFLLALVCTPVIGLILAFLLASDAPSGVYRSAARRAKVAIWLLAGTSAILVASFVLGITTRDAAGVDEIARSSALSSLSALAFYAFIATAGAFLAWLSRAIDNLPADVQRQPGTTPRWAIAWWFIPIANLGMPYEVVRNLRQSLTGEDPRRHPPLLLAWWFCFVIGMLLLLVAASVSTVPALSNSMGELLATIAAGLLAGAGVLGALVVRGANRDEVRRLSNATPSDEEADAERPVVGPAQPSLRGLRLRPSWVGYVLVTVGFAAYTTGTILVGLVGADAASTSTGPSAASLLPHQEGDLEALLPSSVAAQPMAAWSVHGEAYFTDVLGFGPAEVSDARVALAQVGVDLDEMGFAVEGRVSPDDDPYFVIAISFPSAQANQLPTEMFIDYPDAAPFAANVVGGKHVDVGVTAMFDQTASLRGRPYVYSTGHLRFIVVTDDRQWAANALSQLP